MRGKWEEVTIGALLARDGGSIKTGPFGTALKAKEYSATGVPLISVGEVGYGSLQVHEKTPRVPQAVVDRLPEYVLESGDIVFGRKGAVDRCALVKPYQAGWFLGSDGIRLRLPETVDPRFIAFQLQSPGTRAWLVQHATGTTMPSLNQAIIERIPLRIPPLHQQRAIAQVLGTLDDKIELNRRMSETLEAMARALFKSWFVDFDPVRAKAEGRDPGLPKPLADLFPARLVDSELGEIPEGWEVGTLGDVAESPRRSLQPHEISADTAYIALEHMPRRCIALSDWVSGDGIASNKFEFKRGEILFGKLRPYFHKVGVAPIDGVCSTDIVVISPQEPDWFAFVLGLVSSDEFVEFTNAGSTGTKMPRTSWGDMARYELANPPRSIAKAFTDLMRPAVERMISGIHESRTLAALRDALLPKLISGEMRVKEAEKFIGRVA